MLFQPPDRKAGRLARHPPASLGKPPPLPDVSFSDPPLKFADMSGDGLDDIVHINRGRIDWWPSLGYGRFRPSPQHDLPVGLPDGSIRSACCSVTSTATGRADLLHIEDRQVTLWVNRAGLGWSGRSSSRTPPVVDMTSVRLIDLKGSGVSGVLWTASARRRGGRTISSST